MSVSALRPHVAAATVAVATIVIASTGYAPGSAHANPSSPDSYLCYRAALAKGEAKIPKGSTIALTRNGVSLTTWLTRFVTDAPAWTAITP